MGSKLSKNWEFWLSVAIVVLSVVLMFAYYSRWFSFAVRIGPFRVIHYIAWAGTLYVFFGVILFVIFKRRYLQKIKPLLKIHVFGNLSAFLLVSLHFAGQVGRPADFYPEFGTGLALYVVMVILVVTGLALRFRAIPSFTPAMNRFLHVSIAVSFYLVIVFHILHGLELI